MTPRRLLFWLHLSVGIAASLLIAFLAFTGSIISFQSQLVAFAERGIHVTHPSGTPCVLPSTLLANAAASTPRPLTSLTIFTDPARPAQIATGPASNPDGSVLLADACTGQVLGPGANRLRVFLTAVRELHHQATLAGVRHETLRAAKNAAALLFVFLTLSGLYLWFPRHLTWQHLRPAVLLRPGLRGRAREWNLHNTVGFWLCLPLFLISTTGVIMAFPWANALLFRAAGEAPPAPRREVPPTRTPAQDTAPHRRRDTAPTSLPPGAPLETGTRSTPPDPHPPVALPTASPYTQLDAPIARALAFTPGLSSVSLRLPTPDAKSLTFQLARYDRQPVLRDTLTLAPTDARVLKWEPLSAATRGRRWRVTARFLHTGELFGAPGQAIALLSALGALLLVWTGVSLALRRLAAFRRRRQTGSTTAAPEHLPPQPVQVS